MDKNDLINLGRVLPTTGKIHQNQDVWSTGGRRISRVVVHPSYRGVGIGCAMVKKYIADYPDTDVIAAMALYNPIFEKAGMTRVNDSSVKSPAGLRKEIEAKCRGENQPPDGD